jgi:hypothetical protein
MHHTPPLHVEAILHQDNMFINTNDNILKYMHVIGPQISYVLVEIDPTGNPDVNNLHFHIKIS